MRVHGSSTLEVPIGKRLSTTATRAESSHPHRSARPSTVRKPATDE
jgi:hypothetical protein